MPHNEIVVIGSADGVNAQDLKLCFESALTHQIDQLRISRIILCLW